MKLRHKAGAVAATTLLTTAAFAIGASPAQAANPPWCITTAVHSAQHVTVYNDCPEGAGYYVKVIWAANLDSNCHWLRPGYSRWFKTTFEGRYDRTVIC